MIEGVITSLDFATPLMEAIKLRNTVLVDYFLSHGCTLRQRGVYPDAEDVALAYERTSYMKKYLNSEMITIICWFVSKTTTCTLSNSF